MRRLLLICGFTVSVLLISLSLLLPLLSEKSNEKEVISKGISTIGHISALRKNMTVAEKGRESIMMETATIDYKVRGSTFEISAKRQFKQGSWAVGDTVDVYYLTDTPHDGVVNAKGLPGYGSSNLERTIYGASGLLLLSFCCVTLARNSNQ